MPTSNNRIILTDVDGVLLEWEHHFTEWMLQRSYYNDKNERIYPYNLLPNKESTYEMAERFGLTVQQIRKEIREFNKSAWMANQSPMPDSQTWVKLLAVEGWTFIPITSQTSDIPAQLVRKKRLQELFGESTFKNYFIPASKKINSRKKNILEINPSILNQFEDVLCNLILEIFDPSVPIVEKII